MRPAIGGILMVAGMICLMAQPFIGVLLLGIGYWLYDISSPAERSAAAGNFFGIGVLAMIVLGIASLL
jgi:hypothetical protein